MLSCVWLSNRSDRDRQNVVRTSVTHSAIALCATLLFLPHFDVICDLLLNTRTATWNLFVKQIMEGAAGNRLYSQDTETQKYGLQARQ